MTYSVFNDTRILEGAATSLFDVSQGSTLFLGRDTFWSATNQWNSHAITSTGHSTIRIAGQAYASNDAIYSTGAGDLVEVMTSAIVGSHGYTGIRLLGGGEVRNAGEIFGYDGVWLNNGGAVNNAGRIGADRYGIAFFSTDDNPVQLVNTGSITAAYGVITESWGRTTIVNSGTIHGTACAIAIGSGAAATIDNSGMIVCGGGVAIYGGFGGDTITNSGAIVGSVLLQSGDDVFDTSRGTIDGAIDGGAGDDVLIGGGTADLLIGGKGADALDGGAGRDLASYATADAGVTANLADPSANTGDAANDTYASIEGLVGSAFADILTGDAGANALSGGNGGDILDGGAGADVLRGGYGDDTFVVDHRRDLVIELAGEGVDTVRSTIGYTLGDQLENLTLLGKGNIDGTGNALGNVLVGNAGKNALSGGEGDDRLDGGVGADLLIGGNGDDVYVVDHRGDRVVETEPGGVDRVLASIDYVMPEWVEQMELTGGAVRGIGNAGANAIQGTSGDNILDGKAGSDILVGWGGADRFTFSTALDGGANVDTIADFDAGMDKIVLDRSVFEDAGTKLSASAFVIGTTALDADDRLLYDAATGDLRWDADGVGGKDAVLFGHLENAPVLQVGDVVLVG